MRHILVTGAASGIGRAIADAFHQDGAELSLVDVDPEGVRATAERLGAHRLVKDLGAPEAPADAVAHCWETTGPVDVLVNAAGRYPSLDMLELRAPEWDQVFALNTRAPALATAELARRAVAGGRTASVVNISSGAALRSRPGGGPYAASKAALELATRAAALELGEHGIRVNAVSPGFVTVDSTCNPVAPAYAAAASGNPLGRPGTPADIAAAVRWLAGAEAAWITGEVLRVDGGSSTGVRDLPRIWPPHPPGDASGEAATSTTRDTKEHP